MDAILQNHANFGLHATVHLDTTALAEILNVTSKDVQSGKAEGERSVIKLGE